MKYLILLTTLIFAKINGFAQDSDSLLFVKQFNLFIQSYPLESTQLFKFDSLKNHLDTSATERLQKTLELIKILNNIEKNGIYELKNEKSELLAYSKSEKRYYLYMDKNVNLEKIEELSGLLKKENERLLNQMIEMNKIRYYLIDSLNDQLVTDPGGIQIPPSVNPRDFPTTRMFNNNEVQYIDMANKYWSTILSLLENYSCNPSNSSLLKYYKGEEKLGEGWKIIASKRRKLIEYIKIKCVLK
jgi:hypothetical protein